jgi:hypothetical protein
MRFYEWDYDINCVRSYLKPCVTDARYEKFKIFDINNHTSTSKKKIILEMSVELLSNLKISRSRTILDKFWVSLCILYEVWLNGSLEL